MISPELFQLDNEGDKAIEEISKIILNSRKVNFMNELGYASTMKVVSTSALRNNMLFEITNKDSNGRTILHRAAFDH